MNSLKPKLYGVLLIAGLLILLLWNGIFSLSRLLHPPAPAVSSFANVSQNETLLGEDKVYFPFLIEDGTAIIGLTEHGSRFTRLNLRDKSQTFVFPEPIAYAFDTVAYAPDGTKAVTHRFDQSIDRNATSEIPARTTLYNFATGEQTELNPNILEIDWFSSGDRILYLFQKDENHYQVSTAKPDGTNWTSVIDDIPLLRPQLTLSPDGTKALLTRAYAGEPDSDFIDFPLYLIDINQKTLTELLPKGLAHPIWSLDQKRVAYLRIGRENHIGYVSIFDLATNETTDTSLPSIKGKFVWRSPVELLVASPVNPSAEDFILGLSLGLRDQLMQLPIGGEPKQITAIATEPPIDTLIITPDSQTLLFRRFNFLLSAQLPE